jgi:hypothetical protein
MLQDGFRQSYVAIPLQATFVDVLPAVSCCAVCVPQAMKINAKMGGVNVKLLDNPERVS